MSCKAAGRECKIAPIRWHPFGCVACREERSPCSLAPQEESIYLCLAFPKLPTAESLLDGFKDMQHWDQDDMKKFEEIMNFVRLLPELVDEILRGALADTAVTHEQQATMAMLIERTEPAALDGCTCSKGIQEMNERLHEYLMRLSAFLNIPNNHQ